MTAIVSSPDKERLRLADDATRTANWKRWGPYLSERQWGTVREDYSANGDCWNYLSHDDARSRTYRWGEDGLLGFTDRECRLCLAIALWNGKDPILKERLFGLTNPEGNHGEDVKEVYHYLDATPTHSYNKALYRYPLDEFPYEQLINENRRRGPNDREFELVDTGVLDRNRFVDVVAEYAKGGPDDVLLRITLANRSDEVADLHVLPTAWFRNTWSWRGTTPDEGSADEPAGASPNVVESQTDRRPRMWVGREGAIECDHPTLGRFRLTVDDNHPHELLFTENETNRQRLFGTPNPTPYVKDAFHRRVVKGDETAVNPDRTGTKACVWYRVSVKPGSEVVLRLRLTRSMIDHRASTIDSRASRIERRGSTIESRGSTIESRGSTIDDRASRANSDIAPVNFDQVMSERIDEADSFYDAVLPRYMPPDARLVARQAYAGLLWSKQFYHYAISEWVAGDPAHPPPPSSRLEGRNAAWSHLYNRDILSMPDCWEYPWYAAWDLAFHAVAFAPIDVQFAKEQLLLLLREWYMHPNGQIPAYEFAFDDVNPPVHAWACWRVYKMSGPRGKRDRVFLARAFQKLLLNFTWWVNRKDPHGKHVFAGGFLGLDNIGVFDRSQPLPFRANDVRMEQADGTAWMAFYCGNMLSIALELAKEEPAYEDIASKFFEHFVAIADAMNSLGGTGLWNATDGFYYDQAKVDGATIPLKVRSMVGLIPLFAAEIIEDETLRALPNFTKRMRWFLENRSELAGQISYMSSPSGSGLHGHHLLAIPSQSRLRSVLARLLDEREFLSDFGIRSVSRYHGTEPFRLDVDGTNFEVGYTPGESTSGVFGGNSNWRGPIWFPLNYLLIEALERYHHFYGDHFTVECPTGSGISMTLAEVARSLRERLARIFLADSDGRRPCFGDAIPAPGSEHWRDNLLFHEYFHGETGRGLGASHQTGWTALVAPCLIDLWAGLGGLQPPSARQSVKSCQNLCDRPLTAASEARVTKACIQVPELPGVAQAASSLKSEFADDRSARTRG
jgi:Glycosyl hydrolase family 63 C-terminal domain